MKELDELKPMFLLNKFVNFLKKFTENPNNYEEIVIETKWVEDSRSLKLRYDSDYIREDHGYNAWNKMASLIRYDIGSYDEDNLDVFASFYNKKDNAFIYMTCLKRKREEK